MPPKKKGKKANKKKSSGKDGELTTDDKLKLKAHEVDALKDNMAYRRDLSRKTKAAYNEIKDKLDETNVQINEIESMHKASSAYLTHQYKTMQNEMVIKMHQLETELISTKKQLEVTEHNLEKEKLETKRIVKEKDDKIAELEQTIKNVKGIYDSIINTTFDNLTTRLDKKKNSWEANSVQLQTKNKALLAEMGIKIHYI